MTTPEPDDGPFRTCVGCRSRRPQPQLVRCVLVDGRVVVDARRRVAGRGAWLCGIGCLDAAIGRGGFQRAFRTGVTAGSADGLADQLTTTAM